MGHQASKIRTQLISRHTISRQQLFQEIDGQGGNPILDNHHYATFDSGRWVALVLISLIVNVPATFEVGLLWD